MYSVVDGSRSQASIVDYIYTIWHCIVYINFSETQLAITLNKVLKAESSVVNYFFSLRSCVHHGQTIQSHPFLVSAFSRFLTGGHFYYVLNANIQIYNMPLEYGFKCCSRIVPGC